MLGRNDSSVVTTFSRHLVFDLLPYERKDCPLKGVSEATINYADPNIRQSAPKNSLRMLVANVNSQTMTTMPLWQFWRPY